MGNTAMIPAGGLLQDFPMPSFVDQHSACDLLHAVSSRLEQNALGDRQKSVPDEMQTRSGRSGFPAGGKNALYAQLSCTPNFLL
jgi:hypothetical protein